MGRKYSGHVPKTKGKCPECVKESYKAEEEKWRKVMNRQFTLKKKKVPLWRSGLGIWCCCRGGVGCSCMSELFSGLGTSISHGYGQKGRKKERKEGRKKMTLNIRNNPYHSSLEKCNNTETPLLTYRRGKKIVNNDPLRC